jgi:DNA topoisomerase I
MQELRLPTLSKRLLIFLPGESAFANDKDEVEVKSLDCKDDDRRLHLVFPQKRAALKMKPLRSLASALLPRPYMSRKKTQRTNSQPEMVRDPVESAKLAGLRYVTDASPGIRRKRHGKGFIYLGVDQQPIREQAQLQRMKTLAIPPAWNDVWICPSPNGHIQATARDAKGRKQYRYHERWREVRDETKYNRMNAFGEALPIIRKRVNADLALAGLPREKVLATVVRLLETTFIRVGNPEYARDNKSYGLTTMRNRHVAVSGSTLRFQFRGKSGKQHRVALTDPRLAKIIKRCQDLPGQELFQYLEDGELQSIGSAEVNQYLREITGQDFTAKDFRTWAGTVLAALALKQFDAFEGETEAKKNIVEAIQTVAECLGNTPAICRKCYIHPTILEAYLDGSLLERLTITRTKVTNGLSGLRRVEKAVMKLLKQRLNGKKRAKR